MIQSMRLLLRIYIPVQTVIGNSLLFHHDIVTNNSMILLQLSVKQDVPIVLKKYTTNEIAVLRATQQRDGVDQVGSRADSPRCGRAI